MSDSKNFKSIDPGFPGLSTSASLAGTNWDLCFLCQEDKAEQLTRPSKLKRVDVGSGYTSLAENLARFHELSQLPRTIKLEMLDEGCGLEATMISHRAQYHKTCSLKFNNTMLNRAKKRNLTDDGNNEDTDQIAGRKRIRCHSSNAANTVQESLCFFCRQAPGAAGFREAATFKLDNRVRTCAMILEDTDLLARLSAGDVVALGVKYHAKCLVGLYNRARKAQAADSEETLREKQVAASVFAELVLYIEETSLEQNTAPVFKLADLARLYTTRLEQLGIKVSGRVHTTRLKERLLIQFPDMRAFTKGRDVLLAFNDDFSMALAKACDLDTDSDAIYLARAANVVRRQMFGESKPFTGFTDGCQEESVPPSLLALVTMIMEGPRIKVKVTEKTPAALAIAQLLKFNSMKHKRTPGNTSCFNVRHMATQETPFPTYVGLMLHAHTRKRDLVDRLSEFGISISYDRVLRLSATMGENVCEQFNRDQVVCPTKMRGNVFTTAAVDNIDYNPSATTAKDSFHGTAISLLQHPDFAFEGNDRSVAIVEGSGMAVDKNIISSLPPYFTNIPTVTTTLKNLSIPLADVTTLSRDGFKKHRQDEYLWLDHVKKVLGASSSNENISWAAFHASRQFAASRVICPTALLPLFLEKAQTTAMIQHSMYVVKKCVDHLNPGQTPIITFDQPLFALAKQIQWRLPESYGEDKFVVMFGGLHIEMAALKTLGDWLQGSGWVQALVKAEIASPGKADSFLRAAHIMRTRRAHQVTAAALYTLQRRAYERNCARNPDDAELYIETFEDWCDRKARAYPQFQYWAIVLKLELLILVYVRSLRLGSFPMYLDALTELVPWFHALDHTNYARWIPVHLRDMSALAADHPDVAAKFNAGHFTVQKTGKVFSSIPIDQAHEQNNALIKGDGGAVGLTDNPSALRRWMLAGPEVARVIEEFQASYQYRGRQVDTRHHDQTASVQTTFSKDVMSLIDVLEDFGNPFEEESIDLFVLDTKEIAGSVAVENVRMVESIGQNQFTAFTRERLVERTKSFDDLIPRNKLKVFLSPHQKTSRKRNQELVASLKNDVGLFARLYIGCQTRDGNLDEFFRHENQASPPSLSNRGRLRLGAKHDLLACLEGVAKAHSDAPAVTYLVLDGAAIINMLKPAAAKNFDEYASNIFIPYLSSKLKDVKRVDLVWDTYFSDSLKGMARTKRGHGVRRRVIAASAIPTNWQSFLRVDENKMELFKFLSQAAIEWFNVEDRQLVITDREGVLSKPRIEDVALITPCNHEEADSRMLLHVSHAAQHGHRKIMIRTVDTDVVVLAVSVSQCLQPGIEVWLAFGTGKNFRYLPIHEMAAGIGPQKSLALPMFHALTGCDTVSSFAGHGKRSAWTIWAVFPELTGALLKVSSAPITIPEDVMSCIERFVILLYDRTSTCLDINVARKKLFAKKSNVNLIPPTKAALEQHVKRATYQGGHVWGQTLVPFQELPAPTSWGWIRTDDDLYEPYWTNLPEASKTCKELVSCKCKKDCGKRCTCKKAELTCSALCACDGACDMA